MTTTELPGALGTRLADQCTVGARLVLKAKHLKDFS
jgi:hypothetical protein